MAISNGQNALKIEYVGERDRGLYWATTGAHEATLCLISPDNPMNGRLARVRHDIARDQYAMIVLDGPKSKTAVTYHNTMQEAKDKAVAVAVVLARLNKANNLFT